MIMKQIKKRKKEKKKYEITNMMNEIMKETTVVYRKEYL